MTKASAAIKFRSHNSTLNSNELNTQERKKKKTQKMKTKMMMENSCCDFDLFDQVELLKWSGELPNWGMGMMRDGRNTRRGFCWWNDWNRSEKYELHWVWSWGFEKMKTEDTKRGFWDFYLWGHESQLKIELIEKIGLHLSRHPIKIRHLSNSVLFGP